MKNTTTLSQGHGKLLQLRNKLRLGTWNICSMLQLGKVAATDEETERLYQELSRAVKQVPKGDMLLVMGNFNDKVGRRI